MKRHPVRKFSLNDHLGCYGEFNIEDPVCRRFCALSVSCAIEREQNEQMEIWEEMFSDEIMFSTIQ